MNASVGAAFAAIIGEAVVTSFGLAAGLCLVAGLALMWRRRRRESRS